MINTKNFKWLYQPNFYPMHKYEIRFIKPSTIFQYGGHFKIFLFQTYVHYDGFACQIQF